MKENTIYQEINNSDTMKENIIGWKRDKRILCERERERERAEAYNGLHCAFIAYSCLIVNNTKVSIYRV